MNHKTGLVFLGILLVSLVAVEGKAGILSADLSITKVGSALVAVPGETITYTITVGNAGPEDAANSSVADTFPVALTSCAWTCTASPGSSCSAAGLGNINDLATVIAGGNVTYSAVCDIDPAATGALANTATVTADASITDPVLANNSDTENTTLAPTADLSITKTDGQASSIPGTPISYTIVASNAGPSAVTDAVVSDTFAAALQNCSWTSVSAGGATGNTNGAGNIADTLAMPVGSSVTYTVDCDIDPAATGSVENIATIESTLATDPTTANNSANDTNTLGAVADLSITKTDGQASSIPGTPISYTIVASNAGPSAVTDALVSDTFVAALQNCSWTSVSAGGATGNTNGAGNIADTLAMPVGSSVTYTVDCDIDPAATGSLENIATIASAIATDPATGNNSATDTNTLGAVADLSITKTDNQVVHTAGDPITYIIVASNAGPSTVSDAVVSDVFQAPLENCSWISVAVGGASGNSNASGDLNDVLVMPAGSSVTYEVICDIALDASGVLSNTATITSASADDPTPGNASATDDDTVLFSAFPIPALGNGALAVLLFLLALMGVAALRRRMN